MQETSHNESRKALFLSLKKLAATIDASHPIRSEQIQRYDNILSKGYLVVEENARALLYSAANSLIEDYRQAFANKDEVLKKNIKQQLSIINQSLYLNQCITQSGNLFFDNTDLLADLSAVFQGEGQSFNEICRDAIVRHKNKLFATLEKGPFWDAEKDDLKEIARKFDNSLASAQSVEEYLQAWQEMKDRLMVFRKQRNPGIVHQVSSGESRAKSAKLADMVDALKAFEHKIPFIIEVARFSRGEVAVFHVIDNLAKKIQQSQADPLFIEDMQSYVSNLQRKYLKDKKSSKQLTMQQAEYYVNKFLEALRSERYIEALLLSQLLVNKIVSQIKETNPEKDSNNEPGADDFLPKLINIFSNCGGFSVRDLEKFKNLINITNPVVLDISGSSINYSLISISATFCHIMFPKKSDQAKFSQELEKFKPSKEFCNTARRQLSEYNFIKAGEEFQLTIEQQQSIAPVREQKEIITRLLSEKEKARKILFENFSNSSKNPAVAANLIAGSISDTNVEPVEAHQVLAVEDKNASADDFKDERKFRALLMEKLKRLKSSKNESNKVEIQRQTGDIQKQLYTFILYSTDELDNQTSKALDNADLVIDLLRLFRYTNKDDLNNFNLDAAKKRLNLSNRNSLEEMVKSAPFTDTHKTQFQNLLTDPLNTNGLSQFLIEHRPLFPFNPAKYKWFKKLEFQLQEIQLQTTVIKALEDFIAGLTDVTELLTSLQTLYDNNKRGKISTFIWGSSDFLENLQVFTDRLREQFVDDEKALLDRQYTLAKQHASDSYTQVMRSSAERIGCAKKQRLEQKGVRTLELVPAFVESSQPQSGERFLQIWSELQSEVQKKRSVENPGKIKALEAKLLDAEKTMGYKKIERKAQRLRAR